MEEHGLSVNNTLAMLESNITQNNQVLESKITQTNQEAVLICHQLVDVNKSLVSVHKRVKDLDSRSTDLNKQMHDEFAQVYTRLTDVQTDLKQDSDSKIASLQSDIDALTGSINARIAKEMDAVRTTMEEHFASLRAESLTDKAEIEEFKTDLKKAKQLVETAEKEHKAVAKRYAEYMSALLEHRKKTDEMITTTKTLLGTMKEQIEVGKQHSTNMGTLHQLQSSIEARQSKVEQLHESIVTELSKIEDFRKMDLPQFKSLHDSFITAQSKQPTDLHTILKAADNKVLENIHKIESQLDKCPAAEHALQMIHDETKINDLIKQMDDTERALFEYGQSLQADTPPVSQATVSAMVDARMVTYNTRDKDNLRNILDTQCQVL
jgi:chromosome segregation ATPase